MLINQDKIKDYLFFFNSQIIDLKLMMTPLNLRQLIAKYQELYKCHNS